MPIRSTADAVAGTLRSSRNLAGYRIEIQAREGVVTLSGELASPAQKAEALARAEYVAGVAAWSISCGSRRSLGPPGPVSAAASSPGSISRSPSAGAGPGHHRRDL